jgi:hypothetical protein
MQTITTLTRGGSPEEGAASGDAGGGMSTGVVMVEDEPERGRV